MIRGRKAGRLTIIGLMVLAIAWCLVAMEPVSANPFGVGGGPGSVHASAPDGVLGWLLSKQAEFHRLLVRALREARAEGHVQFALIALSFTYGVFHAAGPGHGKAVITSYLLANEQAWRRGIGLSFLSALLQAVVAILVVGIGSLFFDATAKNMNATVRTLESAGFMMIALIGAYLVWTKGKALLCDLQVTRGVGTFVAASAPSSSSLDDVLQNSMRRNRLGDIACSCNHAHGFDPTILTRKPGWRAALMAVLAVGLRPCTGAIVVLVFAWSQDIMLAGMAATLSMAIGTAITVAAIATVAVKAKSTAVRLLAKRDGIGVLAFRGVEVAAAILLLVLGVLLLTGYFASETSLAG